MSPGNYILLRQAPLYGEYFTPVWHAAYTILLHEGHNTSLARIKVHTDRLRLAPSDPQDDHQPPQAEEDP